jgi:hypothetical protein
LSFLSRTEGECWVYSLYGDLPNALEPFRRKGTGIVGSRSTWRQESRKEHSSQLLLRKELAAAIAISMCWFLAKGGDEVGLQRHRCWTQVKLLIVAHSYRFCYSQSAGEHKERGVILELITFLVFSSCAAWGGVRMWGRWGVRLIYTGSQGKEKVESHCRDCWQRSVQATMLMEFLFLLYHTGILWSLSLSRTHWEIVPQMHDHLAPVAP